MSMNIGFVGLGLMGLPMATRLRRVGYELQVYNRTREKAAPLVQEGALLCHTPAEAATNVSVVVSMVTNSQALRDVVYGQDGISQKLAPGAVHVDCSTVSPDVTAELASHYRSSHRGFIHAPVLGSVPQATEGALLLFAGGENDVFERVQSVLSVLGKRIWRFPTAEQATLTKILCNSFIAGTFVMLAQGLVFAQKAGISGSTLLEILEHSTLNSPTIQFKGKTILDRNFSPRFFVDNLLKDTNLMISAGKTIGSPTPVADLARELLQAAHEQGLGTDDYSAAIKVWERLAGVEVAQL